MRILRSRPLRGQERTRFARASGRTGRPRPGRRYVAGLLRGEDGRTNRFLVSIPLLCALACLRSGLVRLVLTVFRVLFDEKRHLLAFGLHAGLHFLNGIDPAVTTQRVQVPLDEVTDPRAQPFEVRPTNCQARHEIRRRRLGLRCARRSGDRGALREEAHGPYSGSMLPARQEAAPHPAKSVLLTALTGRFSG
jgi:hypothetical protein